MSNLISPKLFGIQWHITERCNWHCKHCYQSENPVPDLSLSQLFYIFDQFLALIKKWQLLPQNTHLNITGGEPFVRKDFFQILRRIGKYSHLYNWGILSNGSLVTRENLKKLKEFNIELFQVSMEGLENNNDEIRGKGTFNQTIESIKLLREAGIRTVVSLTLTKKNAEDVIPLAKLLNDLGVAVLGARRLVPWGRGKEMEEYMLQPQELREFYFKIKEFNKKLAQQGERIRVSAGCEAAIFNEELLADSTRTPYPIFCNVVRGGQLNIMANGDILPCRRFPIVVGNALKNDFEQVYYSRQMKDFRTLEKLHLFCKNCSNFYNCFGGAKCVTYGYSQRWDIPDVQCWRAYKKLGDPPPVVPWEESRVKFSGLNEYFPFNLDNNNTLLTTRHGGWAILSKEDYQRIKLSQIDLGSKLFRNLENVGIILTSRNIHWVVSILSRKYSYLFRYPTHHVIAVTNRCNLNCLYCQNNPDLVNQEMSESTAMRVLNFIFSIPMKEGCKIEIQGGEPSLKWDLVKQIYLEAKERAKRKNLRFEFAIGTNATLLTDKIAEEISKMSISLSLSLDGPKKLHDAQRSYIGGQGSYDKVVYGIKKIKKMGIRFSVQPVITKLSLRFGPKAIIDEYLKIGRNTVFLKPFRPTGRALINLEKLAMEPKDFYGFWREGIEYCLSLNKKGVKVREFNAQNFLKNMLPPYFNPHFCCQQRPCGAGFSMLSYTPDGTITACDSARGMRFLDLGHVDEDNYQTIRAKMISLLNLTPDLISICSNCPFIAYCGLCLADTLGRENDIYPKIPRNFSCKWQKMAFEYLFKKFLENKEDAQILQSWVED